MIIFDLDGVLADCEHRRHFVDPSKDPKAWQYSHDDWRLLDKYNQPCTKNKWKPDYQSFYQACDLDMPIQSTGRLLTLISTYLSHIEIWSGHCESVREKTLDWLQKNSNLRPRHEWNVYLKMRPIGDNTPNHELKERWLDEYFSSPKDNCLLRWADHGKCCKMIDMVFDSDPKSIAMWQRRGIFVFNCCQSDGEF